MRLNEFSVGDVVTNNDGEVFEIKQIFSTGSVKVFVKECEENGYLDVHGNYTKPGKTYTVSSISSWELVSPKSSNISNQDFKTMENHIQNLQKELDSAKSSLEKMKKQSIPELIVGEMYKVPDSNSYLNASTILVLCVEYNCCVFIQFFDDGSDFIERQERPIDDFNDGTLIHLNSPEQKKFSKQLFELTKHYA